VSADSTEKPVAPDPALPGAHQTYADGQFSISTNDDPESVRLALGLTTPEDESESDEGDDAEAEEIHAPGATPKPNGKEPPKPNGKDAPPEQPEQSAKQAPDSDQARNPDGTFKTGKKKQTPQQRIDQAVFRQREAERRAEAAEARAREVEARRQESARQAPPQEQPPPPQRQGFPTYAEFLEKNPNTSLEQWLDARDQFREEHRMRQVQEQQQRHQEGAIGAQWQHTLRKAREADPDFDSKVDLTVPVSLPMMDIIKTSPNGPQLMLYLSAHPNEARHLAQLPPATVLRAMSYLDGRLSAANSGPAPIVSIPSQAKPPIQPVSGSSVVPANDVAADSTSLDDHFRHYNAADRKAGRLR